MKPGSVHGFDGGDLSTLVQDVVVSHAALLGSGNFGNKMLDLYNAMVDWGALGASTMGMAAVQDHVKMLSYEDALEHVKLLKPEQWVSARANAKRACRLKIENPLEAAINCMRDDLGSFIEARAKADDCVKSTYPLGKSIGYYPDNISPDMINAEVIEYDHITKKIVCSKFDDFMSTDKHLKKSMALVGDHPGAGKSQLQHSMGRTFGVMYQKESYVFAKAFDPLGVLSRAGIVSASSSIHWSDPDACSQNGVPLSLEALKSVFDVLEGGSYQCRQCVSIFGPELPRTFAINGDRQGGTWFSKANIPVLHHLAMKNEKAVNAASADERAIARRVAICWTPEKIVLDTGVAELAAQTEAKAQQGKERLAQFRRDQAPP
jgi:hypothetical protein